MTYATPTDVAKEVRGSTSVSDVESVQWQTWLGRVERAIESRFSRLGLSLHDQTALGDPTAALVADIEVAVVARRINGSTLAPGTSRTVSVDDGSVTDRNDRGDAREALLLTEDEWELLLPPMAGGAFSTRPGFARDCPMPGSWA